MSSVTLCTHSGWRYHRDCPGISSCRDHSISGCWDRPQVVGGDPENGNNLYFICMWSCFNLDLIFIQFLLRSLFILDWLLYKNLKRYVIHSVSWFCWSKTSRILERDSLGGRLCTNLTFYVCPWRFCTHSEWCNQRDCPGISSCRGHSISGCWDRPHVVGGDPENGNNLYFICMWSCFNLDLIFDQFLLRPLFILDWIFIQKPQTLCYTLCKLILLIQNIKNTWKR